MVYLNFIKTPFCANKSTMLFKRLKKTFCASFFQNKSARRNFFKTNKCSRRDNFPSWNVLVLAFLKALLICVEKEIRFLIHTNIHFLQTFFI